MCDSPLGSALATLGGGGLGLLAGLGPAATAVLAGLLAGVANLAGHVARRDPALESHVVLRSPDES